MPPIDAGYLYLYYLSRGFVQTLACCCEVQCAHPPTLEALPRDRVLVRSHYFTALINATNRQKKRIHITVHEEGGEEEEEEEEEEASMQAMRGALSIGEMAPFASQATTVASRGSPDSAAAPWKAPARRSAAADRVLALPHTPQRHQRHSRGMSFADALSG